MVGGLTLSPTETTPRFSLVMTRNDDHVQDTVFTQKLEWVTPKISLMGAGDTEGKIVAGFAQELNYNGNTYTINIGVS